MPNSVAMRTQEARTWIYWFAVAALVGAAYGATAHAQPMPVARLFSVFPSGGKQGATLDVTIAGADMEKVSRLHFSDPAITAVQKTTAPGLGQTGPQGVPGQFTVTIGPEARPGISEVRAYGKYGVSNPRAFVVSTQDEIVEKEPNNTREQATEVAVGMVVNGQSNSATDQDYFKFTATKGQRVIIDCAAYRIDSRMDPSLVLFDANGRELDRDRDTNRRDPMIDFTAPADGTYYVELHDFLYVGSGEYYYRLSIDSRPHLEFAFPPAGLPGTTGKFTLYGRNLPGGTATDLHGADGKPLESLVVDIALPGDGAAEKLEFASLVEPDESGMDALAYRVPSPQGASNALLIGFASAPVVLEQEPNNEPAQAQAVTLPCELAGQFYPLRDRDWVSFDAKAGQALWIEVFSERFGLPTDPFLLVQQVTKNDKGEEQIKELQTVDDYLDNPTGRQANLFYYDMKTDDPAFRFVAPADGTYRVLVRNLATYTRPDPRLVYRLTIRPESPDFRVVANPRLLPFSTDPNQNPATVWTPLLRKGGTELIDIIVFRRDGFDSEVTVTVDGLPQGVTASPLIIGPGQEIGSLVLSAAEDAPEAMTAINIVGKAKIGDQEIARPARAATMIWGGVFQQVTARSRLARDLVIAVSGGETAPLSVDTGKDLVLETSRAGKVQVPIKMVRRGDFKATTVLAPVPLPTNVKPVNVTLDDKTAEGKLEIALPVNIPPGTYTFSVVAATQVNYGARPRGRGGSHCAKSGRG